METFLGLPQEMDGEVFARLDSFALRSLRLAGHRARRASLGWLTSLKISRLNDYDEESHTILQKSFERLTALRSLELHTRPQDGLLPLPQNPSVSKSITLNVNQRPSFGLHWEVISTYCHLPGLTYLAVSICLPRNLDYCESEPLLDFRILHSLCPAGVAVRLALDDECPLSSMWSRDCAAICEWTSLVELRCTPRCLVMHKFSTLIRCLPAFTRLRSLEFVPFDEDHPLRIIASLTALTCLMFRWLGHSTVPLMDISTLNSLRVLHASGSAKGRHRLGSADLEPVSRLTSLCELGGNLDIGSPKFLQLLARLPCLTSIAASANEWRVQVEAWALRASLLPALRCLDAVVHSTALADAEACLMALPSIKSLCLMVFGWFALHIMQGLWRTPQLTKLVLQVQFGNFVLAPHSLAFLSNLTQLEHLSLSVSRYERSGMECRSAHMRILGRLTSLTRLEMLCGGWGRGGEAMSWKVVHPLSALRRLSVLKASWSWRLDEDALTRLNAFLLEMGLAGLRLRDVDTYGIVHYSGVVNNPIGS